MEENEKCVFKSKEKAPGRRSIRRLFQKIKSRSPYACATGAG